MQIDIRPATASDEPCVQKIFERTPDYFRRTDCSIVLPQFAKREMTDGPPKEKQSPTYEKVFCLISADDVPIGVVDLHRDHPEAGITYIGLLLIDQSKHGQGLGRLAYEATENFVGKNLRAQTIRLGVSEDNDVEWFWSKMGFVRNGRTYQWQGGSHTNQVFEMEKKVN